MRIFALNGSLRKDSLNHKLIQIAGDLAQAGVPVVHSAELGDFNIPVYDGDLEAAIGIPEGVADLIRRIEVAESLFIASPKYNASFPGSLKNDLDCVSRRRSGPLKGKMVLLLSASPSRGGGIRGLKQLRIPLEAMGAIVGAKEFSLSLANEAVGDRGQLLKETDSDKLENVISGFLKMRRETVFQ
jgi:chromate reductase, NAD(P)H dehydrogenase (quinone)